jgi:hypothetical protein
MVGSLMTDQTQVLRGQSGEMWWYTTSSLFLITAAPLECTCRLSVIVYLAEVVGHRNSQMMNTCEPVNL